MATAPNDQPQMSWEDTIMRHRESLKLEFIHFQDNIFGILDPFFKMSMKLGQQIESITQENIRLMDLCKKNNVDITIPEPDSKEEKPIPEPERKPPGKLNTYDAKTYQNQSI